MQSFSSVAGTNLIHKRPITAGAIHAYVVDRLVESGLRTVHSFSAVYTNNNRFSHASSYKNELHPCHSLSIFAVTNMQRSKVDKTIREVLVGLPQVWTNPITNHRMKRSYTSILRQ